MWLRDLFGLDKPCEACEVLKEALAVERQFNKVMFERLVPPARSDESNTFSNVEPKKPFIPWRIKREMLEKEDRNKARVKSTEELEKELEING
jgi:hypothetical protein